MATDEERRDIAAKLRELDEHHGWDDFDQEVDDIETVIGCNLGQPHESQSVERRLADLIDRPTCHMDLTDTYKTAEGLVIRSWECDRCGRTCEEVYGDYDFCPHCGAMVVPCEG